MLFRSRKVLKDYLFENWTRLEDFKSNELCLAVARQLGATGAILGTLTEKNGNVNLTLRFEGFGPAERQDDIFAWRDRTVLFPLTEELRSALYHPGPNYTRSADQIPEELGVFRLGSMASAAPMHILSESRLCRRRPHCGNPGNGNSLSCSYR